MMSIFGISFFYVIKSGYYLSTNNTIDVITIYIILTFKYVFFILCGILCELYYTYTYRHLYTYYMQFNYLRLW